MSPVTRKKKKYKVFLDFISVINDVPNCVRAGVSFWGRSPKLCILVLTEAL